MLSDDAKTLVATVLMLLVSALGTALLDRWTKRKSLLPKFLDRRHRQDDCPWPVDDERPASLISPHSVTRISE